MNYDNYPALPEPELEDHPYEIWGQNAKGNFYSEERLREAQRGMAAECFFQLLAYYSDNSEEAELLGLSRAMEILKYKFNVETVDALKRHIKKQKE